jgi:ATP phosphoribosyltransferase regulatory subunit
LRTQAEIDARLAWLADEATAPPLPVVQADALDALLDLEGTMAGAASRLHDIEIDLAGLAPAVERFEAREAALAANGVDTSALPFATTAGRGAMEYYDGFTFSFASGGETVAIGGRYDALMEALGDGRAAQAVGGVIRPGLLGDPT